MRTVDIIYRKRQGQKLTGEEIEYLIDNYTRGEIPDYQMSAWAMAVYFQGMDREETAHLTAAMADSGDRIDLSEIPGLKVDKHSTGGVGDTTSLILVPLVAAAGIPVAKMSGRGLGHTGGTIDKLESIPGFNTELSRDRFFTNVRKMGAAIVSQSGNLTPADKKLYALRDVTATVESIPLIASSIMSKKIAGGADRIVLDVKVGSGAFMKKIDRARQLAGTMVDIGKEIGRETIAMITDMEQPLGLAIGNALEVKEAINILQDQGPDDLRELCLTLGSNMLYLAGKVEDSRQGYNKLEQLLASGKALEKLQAMIAAQDGKTEVVADPDLLPTAAEIVEISSTKSGYITGIDAEEIGRAAMQLGAGRETKGQMIDPAAGIVINKKTGDYVNEGEPLAFAHFNDGTRLSKVEVKVKGAFYLAEKKPEKSNLIYDIIK